MHSHSTLLVRRIGADVSYCVRDRQGSALEFSHQSKFNSMFAAHLWGDISDDNIAAQLL